MVFKLSNTSVRAKSRDYKQEAAKFQLSSSRAASGAPDWAGQALGEAAMPWLPQQHIPAAPAGHTWRQRLTKEQLPEPAAPFQEFDCTHMEPKSPSCAGTLWMGLGLGTTNPPVAAAVERTELTEVFPLVLPFQIVWITLGNAETILNPGTGTSFPGATSWSTWLCS